jgi:hypothetical protein
MIADTLISAFLRIRTLERKNETLVRTLRKLVNNLPEPEIELARSAWGNTNTACVLEARKEAAKLLEEV